MQNKQKYGLIGGLLIAILLAIPIYEIAAPFLMPIFLGAVLAMISRPLYLKLSGFFHKRNRLSGLLATLIIVLIVVAPTFAILWFASKEAITFIQDGKIIDSIQSWFHGGAAPIWFTKMLDWLSLHTHIDRSQIADSMTNFAKSAGITISKLLGSWLAALPQLLLGIFITIISTYYLFVDGDKAASFVSEITPLTKSQQSSIYNTFEGMCRAVVIGTIATAAIQGLLIGFGFLIFGVPQALLFTIVAAFMAMVPFVGASPVWIGGAIYLLIDHHTFSGIGLAIFGILISLMDNIIKPWIMSGKSNLHPLLVLISVIGGIGAFGLTGVFLGPVLMGVFVSVLRIVSHIKTSKAT